MSNVFAWGQGTDGQLGTGETLDAQAPIPLEAFRKAQIRSMAAGQAHSAAVLDDGSLLTWGSGVNGQLGHGSTLSELRPSRVEGLLDVPIAAVACGGQHTLALTAEQQVLSWGLNEFGQLGSGGTTARCTPGLVEALRGRPVIQLAAGWAHSVALTADGDVYTWGRGFEGQLGLGAERVALAPRYVRGLDGRRVVSVAAGFNFTACVTDSGELWMFGDGSAGQLGQGGDKSVRCRSHAVPVRVDALLHTRMRSVACGWGHTAALSEDGQLYVWGLGMQGQLGRGSTQPLHMPNAPLEPLPGAPIVRVQCGDHFVVALTASQDVYTWGSCHRGRLGHADTATNETTPRLVAALQRTGVREVVCGWGHVFAVLGGAS